MCACKRYDDTERKRERRELRKRVRKIVEVEKMHTYDEMCCICHRNAVRKRQNVETAARFRHTHSVHDFQRNEQRTHNARTCSNS